MPAMRAVDRLMEEAVTRRVFPSACLLVALEGQPLIHRAYGRGQLDTVYDLASLTKPLATTAALMQLVARGELDPESLLCEQLPELRGPARELRLWHLLAHASGLPAWRPFFEQVQGLAPARRRQAIRRLAAATPLEAPPGKRVVYSDLGFILLDWALERASGLRLDRLAAREVYGPLALRRTCFLPLDDRRADALRAQLDLAPTERCPWRGRRLVGEVHDDNCSAMGGVSGHAGLFSTAYEVHLLARELWLAHAGERSIFERETVRRFLGARPVRGETRALGWDRPSAVGASCGAAFSRRAVGHLGFTGTSLWIDLERPLWVVLLTNRVYHGREPNPMKALRPRLHDAALRALDGARR